MPRAKKKNKKQTGVVYLFRNIAIPLPLFIFILLAAGVILAGWTAEVTGASFFLRAKVAAPQLISPAVIDLPVSGDTLKESPTNVSGICPLNSYVEIFRNGIFSGTALCSDSGTFQLAIGLVTGTNKLTAQDYNTTDDPGPSSSSVTVTYAPPTTPTGGGDSGSGDSTSQTSTESGSGSSQNSGQATESSPAANDHYILNTDGKFQYSGYFTGQTVVLRLVAGGGVPPYTYDVDWGDHDPRYIIYKDGPFTLTHTYSRAGEFHGSHTIKITGTDAKGKKTFMQLFVIVNAKPNTIASTGGDSSSGAGSFRPIITSVSKSAKWLWVAWPAYGIVLLMSVSYILGEREELFIIRHKRA